MDNLRRAVVGAGIVVLLAALTAVNASSGTPDHGKRLPEKQSVSRCLLGKVCVGDVLRIDVLGEPTLSGRYPVDPAGGIAYPFVGRLAVSGLKPAAVAQLIADGLKKAHTGEPEVSVEIEAAQNAGT